MVTDSTIEVLVVSPDREVVTALEQVGRQTNGLLLLRPSTRQFVFALRRVQPQVVIVQLAASPSAPQALEWIALVRDRWPWVRRIAVMLESDERMEIAARTTGIDFFLHAGEPLRLLPRVLADIMGRTPSRAGPCGSVPARSDAGTPERNTCGWPNRGPPKQPLTPSRNVSTSRTVHKEKGESP